MPTLFCVQVELGEVSMREPNALETFNATDWEEEKFEAGSAEFPLLARGIRISMRIMVGVDAGECRGMMRNPLALTEQRAESD